MAKLASVSINDLIGELHRRFTQEQVDARKQQLAESQKVEMPDWFKPEEWKRLQGDASGAFNDWFKVYWKGPDRHGDIDIKIMCPQFLRGDLTLTVHKDGFVSGSY